MKSTSKVIMGATLVMVVSLAMVLALILILLAELYCSLLLLRRRRHHHNTKTNLTSSIVNTEISNAAATELSSEKHDYDNAEPVQQRRCDHYIVDIGSQEISSISLVHLPQPEQEETNIASEDHHHLIYISNPVFDNEASRANTPFETPETSPSRLDDNDDEVAAQATTTPPLTPMKKLPKEACSVSLKDASSLATSGSDSNSASSESGSPCTSPSW